MLVNDVILANTTIFLGTDLYCKKHVKKDQ